MPARRAIGRWLAPRAGAAASKSSRRGAVTAQSRPFQRTVAPPAARTLRAHWVDSPNGIGMTKPSAVRRATTGVRRTTPVVPTAMLEDGP